MDTNEQEPVGGEGATSPELDTSQDIAQPTESDDSVSDGNTAEVEEAPQLLAGKYKTPEELEKGYQELQSKLGEVGQKSELVNLLEKQTGMNASQIKDYLANQQNEQLMQQYNSNPVPYLANELAAVKSQLALQAEEKELDMFLSSDEGKPYSEFKDKILKLGLNSERDKPYADIAREWFGTARAQGQQDAYKKIETKKMTHATSTSRTAPKGKMTAEDMDKMTAAELEAILPHADISNRPY